MHPKGLFSMSNFVPLRKIVETAINLISAKGSDFHPEGLPGKIQKYENDNFMVLYTTPFSGLEFLPGKKGYCIDIWCNNKKVLNCVFDEFESITGNKRVNDWIEAFLRLA